MSILGGQEKEEAVLDNFVCPFCQGTEYENYKVEIAPDDSIEFPGLYFCTRCSIMFQDPEKILRINKQ